MGARSRWPVVRRKHRLPREAYRGHVSAAFTACIAGGHEAFTDGRIVGALRGDLTRACTSHKCEVLLYCFMPEHLHLLLRGTEPGSDLWMAMTLFKQLSGHRLSQELPGVKWQGDFFDHLIRDDHELMRQLRYVAENPIRRGLVDDWRSYPFLGSDVYDLCIENGPA